MSEASLVWIKQIGTPQNEEIRGLVSDNQGNVYMTGYTSGTLAADPQKGSNDIFVTKYDALGRQVWLRQIGSAFDDRAHGITLDHENNVYICGSEGEENNSKKAYLAKFSANGEQVFGKQLASTNSGQAYGVAIGEWGGVYVCGSEHEESTNAFLVKLQSNGAESWRREIATATTDEAMGIDTDAWGNVYVTGHTQGEVVNGQYQGNSDAFLAKYDYEGNQLWIRQIGSPDMDIANEIATDNWGNVFVCGRTTGDLTEGEQAGTVFLAKFDYNGEQLWVRQTGAYWYDQAYAVTADSKGNAFICGFTYGSLGAPQEGWGDLFLAKYGPTGDHLWVKQMGSWIGDVAYAITCNEIGHVFVGGGTSGSLASGANQGSNDAFLAKYVDDLPPSRYQAVVENRLDQIALRQIEEERKLETSLGELEGRVSTLTAQIEKHFEHDPGPKLDLFLPMGGPWIDVATSIVCDEAGNVVVCGITQKEEAADEAATNEAMDLFVAKYDRNGQQVWMKELGTPLGDEAYDIGLDLEGNIVICGRTAGELEAGAAQGDYDAFLAKLDANGALLWLTQFGTSHADHAGKLAVDKHNNIMVSGMSGTDENHNMMIATYDTNGNPLNEQVYDFPGHDYFVGAAIDTHGNFILGAYSQGGFGTGTSADLYQALVAKYHADGQGGIWEHLIGDPEKHHKLSGMTCDRLGNVWVCGQQQSLDETSGSFYIIKYDPFGVKQWQQEIPAPATETPSSITVDSLGNLLFCSFVERELAEGETAQHEDVIMAKYDPKGNLLWMDKIGGTGFERAFGIATNSLGHIWICGLTTGNWGLDPAPGTGSNAFIARFVDDTSVTHHHQMMENQLSQLHTRLDKQARDLQLLQQAQLPLDLDLVLIQAANDHTRGRGEGRLSQKEAEELVVMALDAEGHIGELQQKTLAFIFARYHLTNGAKAAISVALSAKYTDREVFSPPLGEPDWESLINHLQAELTQQGQTLAQLQRAQLPFDLDLALIQAANDRVQGRGESRISKEEAEEIVAIARNEEGKVSDQQQKTLAFLLARYNLTAGAKDVVLHALE